MPSKLSAAGAEVFVGRQHLHAALELLTGPGLLPLPLHLGLETVQVNVEVVLASDLGREFGREAVGVVEDEGVAARDNSRTGSVTTTGGLTRDHVQQDIVAAAEGLCEPFLLEVDHAQDEIAVEGQLAVDVLEPRNDLLHHLAEEGAGQAQPSTVADGAPDHAPQHVAPALVARHHAVPDQECRGPGVFGDDAKGKVSLGVGAVVAAGEFAGLGDDGGEQVGLVDVVLALQDDGGTFQPHAGVHAGGGKGRAVALGVLVVLHEHQVPQLNEPLAVAVGVAAVHLAGGGAVAFLAELRGQDIDLDHAASATALLDSAVVVDLGAGSGWAFGARRSPPVVLVAVAVDTFRRNADLVVPDVVGLVVVQVDGDVEPVGGEAEQLRNQLPGEVHRAILEVVADAEVAQHLEEGEVLVVAHLVDVGGAEALLAAGEPSRRRGLLAHEERLEGHHPGAGEQQRRVASGDERGRRHVLVALALEVMDECIPDLVAVHGLQLSHYKIRE